MSPSTYIRLEGFTRIGRHEMMAKLRDAFQAAKADRLDFQMFSNTAVSLSFEVRGDRLGELGSALFSTGLALDDESVECLRLANSAVEPVSGSLNVTFIHNDPDLRIPVPPIPG